MFAVFRPAGWAEMQAGQVAFYGPVLGIRVRVKGVVEAAEENDLAAGWAKGA